MSEPWREIVAPDEDERFARHAEALAQIQANKSGRTRRALHNKQHAGVRAELTVLDGIPTHARVGVLAEPKTYAAWVRFSNGSASSQSDHKPDVRGFAIKVLGVPGKKILPGLEDAATQDFLLIDTPAIPFRDADEFIAFAVAAQSPALLVPRLVFGLGPGRTFELLKKLLGGPKKPRTLVARYWSAAPIRLGEGASRVAIIPSVIVEGPESSSPDFLREDLAARLARGEVSFDVFLQLYVDATKTPIEDASVVWSEADTPLVKVAKLVLPSQDLASAEGKKNEELVEKLSFDPWHAPEAMRPLGNIMRARRVAYKVSAISRQAMPEPVERMAEVS